MLKQVVTATAVALTIGLAQASTSPVEAWALDDTQLVAQAEGAKTEAGAVAPDAGAEAGKGTAQAEAADGGSVTSILEDQQVAHDKYVVDRFLLAISVVFAVISAFLLFSLPPKRREQKE